jgi:hypothetical protein
LHRRTQHGDHSSSTPRPPARTPARQRIAHRLAGSGSQRAHPGLAAAAHDFGLLPVSDADGAATTPSREPQAPEQLLHDEEPEAFDDQSVDEDDEDEPDEERRRG